MGLRVLQSDDAGGDSRSLGWDVKYRGNMLTAGTRIGAYEVTGSIGAGGMGEVYRARDTRLNRDVALKILPEIFASHPERLARFEREVTRGARVRRCVM